VTAWFKHYPEGLKDIDPHLETLNVPVHVFWGDQDAFLTTDNAARLHKRLPKSALTIFERCGHFCYQDKGVEFTELVRTWLNNGHKLG
jgi:pimeloyl-ACP methyl ester carboxylesterase